jgi:hypothetical protein
MTPKRTSRVTRLQWERTHQQVHVNDIPCLASRVCQRRRRESTRFNEGSIHVVKHIGPNFAYGVYLVELPEAGVAERVDRSVVV